MSTLCNPSAWQISTLSAALDPRDLRCEARELSYAELRAALGSADVLLHAKRTRFLVSCLTAEVEEESNSEERDGFSLYTVD